MTDLSIAESIKLISETSVTRGIRCPHCLVTFAPNWQHVQLGIDAEFSWWSHWCVCANCSKIILVLDSRAKSAAGSWFQIGNVTLVHPRALTRPPTPAEVPEEFAPDYREACLVLGDSEKASAALSRRCLQAILRAKANVKPSDLAGEIQQTLNSKQLPSQLADALDAVRVVGNFAAHPIKAQNTGAILDVEPGEAEWSLEVLEGLFDFYFVQPERLKKKRDALNQKLQQAGKPPLKSAPP